MTAGKEAALEMALASNALMVTHNLLREGMKHLVVMQEEETLIKNPHANMVAKILLKSDDIIGVILDRYNVKLGEVTDETPDIKDEVIEEIKGHDVINAVELILHMTAQDKMAQLKMRGL